MNWSLLNIFTKICEWLLNVVSSFQMLFVYNQYNPHSFKISFPASFWLKDRPGDCSGWIWKAEEENWLVSGNSCPWTWNLAYVFIAGSWDHWRTLPAAPGWSRCPLNNPSRLCCRLLPIVFAWNGLHFPD